MIIKSLHIVSFGGLKNRDIELCSGVNILGGANESGKTSAAMFIKFIFYGLSAKATKAGPSERQKYINRDTMQASGFIIAESSMNQTYRLERTIIVSDNSPAREKIRIINQTTGETITGQNPGDYFFGVPEEVFVSTCFVSQSAAIKPETNGLDRIINSPSSATAVENLLTTASEDIDIKRVLKKLDSMRRELCHKNGNGGEINTLREKRGAMIKELNESEEKAYEIISVGASLDDIKRRVSELEDAADKYAKLFSALDKIVVKRRIDAMNQTKNKLSTVKKQIEQLDASPLGNGSEEALAEAERSIHSYDELVIAYDDDYSNIGENTDTSGIYANAEEDIKEVHRMYNDSKTKIAVSIALMTASLIGLAAFIVLYIFNTNVYSIPLITSLALAVIGAIFIGSYIKSKTLLNDILDKWNAESAEEIENAVEDKLASIRTKNYGAEGKDKPLKSIEAAKLRFDAAEAYINSLAESVEIERGESIYDTISALHDILEKVKKKRTELVSLSAKLNGRLDTLFELTEGVDTNAAELEASKILETDIGKAAASLDAKDIKAAVKEREFAENALKSALKRKTSLEERLLELGKLNHTPDEYKSMINSLDEQIEELSLRHDAYELAVKVIGEAGESMRSGIAVRLAESASELMRSCTPHEKITLDSTLNAALSSGNEIISSEHFSRGTSDLTYISLRCALCEEVFKEETPPIILDESFAHVDGERVHNFLRAISDGQYLILTCREDEIKAAESLGMNAVYI